MEKDNIFFNMDEVYRNTQDPLFVVEGPLDSISIGKNAVALTGSDLSDFRIDALKRISSKRKIIFVLDKNLNGYKLGREVLDRRLGMVTTFPENIGDSNEALKKLGKIWLSNHLISSPVDGFQGKVLLEMIKSNWT